MKLKKGTEREYDVFRAERTLEPDYRATLLYMESWAEAMEQELEKGATMEEAVLKTRFQNAKPSPSVVTGGHCAYCAMCGSTEID